MKKTIIEIKNGEIITASKNEKDLINAFNSIWSEEKIITTLVINDIRNGGRDKNSYNRDALITIDGEQLEAHGSGYALVAAVLSNLAVLTDHEEIGDIDALLKYISDKNQED